MEESLKKAEVPARGGDKQRYWGSVRFYKHMILLTIAALIIVPATLLVIIFCKYKYLEKQYVYLRTEYDEYVFQNGRPEGQAAETQGPGEQTVETVRQEEQAAENSQQGKTAAMEAGQDVMEAGQTQDEQAVIGGGRQEGQAALEDGRQDGQAAMEDGRQDGQTGPVSEEQGETAFFEENKTVVQMLGAESSTIPFIVDFDSWNYLLVNDKHPLPQDYEPVLAGTRNGKEVDQRIKYNLERMLDAAEAEGLKMIICSAYRNYEKQNELIDESIAQGVHKGMSYENAFFESKRQLGRLGCSEHHTGLAVDLVGESYQSLDSGQAHTREAQWLEEHACEYGFILRYPEDKEDITGIDFESWHYRYVGRDAAMYIKEHNLCLEEFLELAAKQQSGNV